MGYRVTLPPETVPDGAFTKSGSLSNRKTGDSGDPGDNDRGSSKKSWQDKEFGHRHDHHDDGQSGDQSGDHTDHLKLDIISVAPVAPPIKIAPARVVIAPELFVTRTLADLKAWVEAENRGSRHWAVNLVDKKLEQLKLCGVIAEIRRIQ